MRRVFFGIVILLVGVAARADDPLADLRRAADRSVREELAAHWYPAAIDAERGGFHQNFARDWTKTPDDARTLVYQCRMTWTAAAFARFDPAKREEYARYARHGVAYLDRVMRDKAHGGFHWTVRPDGTPDPDDSGEKHVYGIAFVLYAASEAALATEDEVARKVARDAFDWLEAKAHDPARGGYFESLTREGVPFEAPESNAPLASRLDRLGVYHGYKSMNVHIHLLEALAAAARIDERPAVRQRLGEVLAIVRDRIVAEPGGLNLYFNADWKPAPAHDSFGHDVETAFLLVEAAHVAGLGAEARTARIARLLVDHALDWGWDDEYGGFYDKGDSLGARAYDTTKVWWTQAEGLNVLVLMHERYGRETDRYAKAALKQWDFIVKHQIDPEHGGWFGETTREGKLLGDGAKAHAWKANYHTSRALMNVARGFGSILEHPRSEATQ